jgi:clusterin-associated protein 1
MVQRYDPDIVMSDNIETEEARVHFLTKTAEALLNKANIKLNTKNLYMADGHAVRELLKVAKTLYAANEAQEAYKAGEELPDVPSLGTKSKDIRVARQLAADITDRGARLHDLLGHENDVKQDRQAALRFLDTISSNLDGGDRCGNQPVCRVHIFLGCDAAVLVPSSGEEAAPPRHRTDIMKMAWRPTRRVSTNAP